MIAIDRILCPVDFSDYSRRALDVAMAIARWYGATVTALHVYAPPLATPLGADAIGPVTLEPLLLTPADRDRLAMDLKKFVAAESAPGVKIETLLREGDPVTEILEQATRMDAQLLVIGTHGRSGFERLLLGSVTERLLHKIGCAVLTVPPGNPDAVPAAAGLFKSILCAVDFSPSSLTALDYALSLAREADARLVVVHVVAHEIDDTLESSVAALGSEHLTLEDFRARREEELRAQLSASVPPDASTYCDVATELAHGKPWKELLRIAGERRADLIVIGVRGRGVADITLFGSTAQHIVRKAACPVLTLKHGESA